MEVLAAAMLSILCILWGIPGLRQTGMYESDKGSGAFHGELNSGVTVPAAVNGSAVTNIDGYMALVDNDVTGNRVAGDITQRQVFGRCTMEVDANCS